MTESDRFVELHNEIKSLLDVKDFNSVNRLMESYCNGDSSVGDLNSIEKLIKVLSKIKRSKNVKIPKCRTS